MKKIIVFALMLLVCASMASAQIRPRVNVDGNKLNYLSDSLVVVYSPDSVKLCGSSKSNPQTEERACGLEQDAESWQFRFCVDFN